MESLPEFVGTIHIFLGPYRGNPIALYLLQDSTTYKISPRIYPWSGIIGTGENANKAAADFEEKWKQGGLSSDMYTGPHWEGGIKPEKPKPAAPPKPASPPPPKPASAQSDTAAPTASSKSETPAEATPAPSPETS